MAELFLDSGAFSVYSQGKEVDIYEYIDFIKKHKRYIDYYVSLDVLGDVEKSVENFKLMKKEGLNPIPCYHVDEPREYLLYYMDNSDYVGIGGMGSGRLKHTAIWSALDDCWEHICDTPDRKPKVKVHGFALTGARLIYKYPWYSVDSSTWAVEARLGCILIARRKNRDGTWDYGTMKRIAVSTQSPQRKDSEWHYQNMKGMTKEWVEEFVKDMGYKMGVSNYKTVDNPEEYKLKDDEQWFRKKKGEVEVVVEAGVTNVYQLRNEFNICYYKEIEKEIPEYPWAWNGNKGKGFGL